MVFRISVLHYELPGRFPLRAIIHNETDLLAMQCGRSASPTLVQVAPSLVRVAPSLVRVAPSLVRVSPSLVRVSPSLVRVAPPLVRVAPKFRSSRIGSPTYICSPPVLRIGSPQSLLVQYCCHSLRGTYTSAVYVDRVFMHQW